MYVVIIDKEVIMKSLKINKNNRFRILQLTDIQYDCDIDSASMEVNDAVIAYASPDLIILTGDNVGGEFLLGAKKKALSIVKQVRDCYESKNIPWSTCFGNHDGMWSKHAKKHMMDVYLQGENFIGGKDNVVGEKSLVCQTEDTYTNYFFPVCDNTGKAVYGIMLLDCATAVFSLYKGFYDSQQKFYDEISKSYPDLPIVLFTHIPLKEMQYAYDNRDNPEKVKAFVGEIENPRKGKVYYAKKDVVQNGKFSQRLLNYANIKGVFVGHDHLANFATVISMKEGYDMLAAYGRMSSYGMKAWKYVPFSCKDKKRYNAYLRGGRIVDLYADGSLSSVDLAYDIESKTVKEYAKLTLSAQNAEKI